MNLIVAQSFLFIELPAREDLAKLDLPVVWPCCAETVLACRQLAESCKSVTDSFSTLDLVRVFVGKTAQT